MIRCNQCMETFETEEDLSLIVEKSEFYEGNWHTTDRFIYNPEMELEIRKPKDMKFLKVVHSVLLTSI